MDLGFPHRRTLTEGLAENSDVHVVPAPSMGESDLETIGIVRITAAEGFAAGVAVTLPGGETTGTLDARMA